MLILLKSAEDQTMTEIETTDGVNDDTETQPSEAEASASVVVDKPVFDINILDAKGNNALHLAAMTSSSTCEKVIRVLLENGADPNVGNWIGYTPLHLFCAHQDGPGSVVDAFVR